ncbi:hypothetical protein F2Q68_00042983 [Brassica cretica]|uniref:Uncharacterized protein n=1 Tax=Brassica cretica TaxID=69181 RepID=A0A8S9LMW2_BRACR|nr:hypothetical protein F2Q68_00042983 [Brassica cretica]
MESNHEVYAMLKAAVKFLTQFSPWSSSLLNVFLPLTNRFEFLDMVVMHEVLLWEQEKNEANGQEKEQCRSTRCGPGVLAGEATATKVTDVRSFP